MNVCAWLLADDVYFFTLSFGHMQVPNFATVLYYDFSFVVVVFCINHLII